MKIIHFHRRVAQNRLVMLHLMRTYFLLLKSIFLHWDWILVLILASKITPKSTQDSSDASKSLQIRPKIDFEGPKSPPKAAKTVQDAPERASISSKMAPMPTSELTKMLRRSQKPAWKPLNGSESGFGPPKTLVRSLTRYPNALEKMCFRIFTNGLLYKCTDCKLQ